jgi:hypothetical protein
MAHIVLRPMENAHGATQILINGIDYSTEIYSDVQIVKMGDEDGFGEVGLQATFVISRLDLGGDEDVRITNHVDEVAATRSFAPRAPDPRRPMSKSLAELRASQHTALPERTIQLCLSQALVAEVQSLQEEYDQILQTERVQDGEPKKPKRQADKRNPRLVEIEARFDELAEEMREHTGELRIRAITGGAWRRWVDAHPAREAGRHDNGQPIYHPLDESIAYGIANAVDLYHGLSEFAISWNGADLAEGDWEFIANRAAPGDLNELCRQVVQMHEAVGAKAPLSRRRSSETTPVEAASSSPSSSE